MKRIKTKLITWLGLAAVGWLPASVGAAPTPAASSGILGQLAWPGEYDAAEISNGKTSVSVNIGQDGAFEVNLQPGRYVLTLFYFPIIVPGQPHPNYVLDGPSIRVIVTQNHFTTVEIPANRFPVHPSEDSVEQ